MLSVSLNKTFPSFLPGDTLYYKFIVDPDQSSPSWGYKFMITAGTRDSFETGHTILNSVLSADVAE